MFFRFRVNVFTTYYTTIVYLCNIGGQTLNIYDISKEAGVSIATVSRVLNGNTNVKAKTKKKVMDVIDKYGYTPNAFARGLGLNSMNSIGIICADCSDIYLAKAVYYIEGNLRKGGYNTILTCSGYELEGKKSALNLLLNRRVDAVIMVGSNFIYPDDKDNAYIREAAEHVPMFMLNADLDCPNVYCTMCDDFKAMQDTTLALINSGIKDILYFYNSTTYSSIKKLTGFHAAYNIKGLDINKDLIVFCDNGSEDIDGAYKFLEDTCNKKKLKFDAIMTSVDELAIAAVKFAKSRNLRIPEDVSIIGYNNSLLALCTDPEITSVDNQLEPLCNQLVKTCIGRLNGEEMPQKIIFSGELIKRGTTNLT